MSEEQTETQKSCIVYMVSKDHDYSKAYSIVFDKFNDFILQSGILQNTLIQHTSNTSKG